MPVFTLQAISVKGRLMVMLRPVKSVTTGGITFATGENPRFLRHGKAFEIPRQIHVFFSAPSGERASVSRWEVDWGLLGGM